MRKSPLYGRSRNHFAKFGAYADVAFLCKAADGASSEQHRIIEHLSYSAVSTSWAHNTVPSIFKYSPHKLRIAAIAVRWA
jgi:hypothetical protein